MAEQTDVRRERKRPEPTGLGSPLDPVSQPAGIVTIRRGLHSEQLHADGLTVREIRSRYADRFEIDAHNQAFLNGRPLDDESHVVRAGDQLDFMPNAGEKG